MKLFISYSHDDQNYVSELARQLNEKAQHNVWIDKRLLGGQDWWDAILDSIEACNCFVVMMTPRACDSISCQAELKYALALGKPILPLKLKDCTIPKGLELIQYIDIRSFSLSETLFQCDQALHQVEVMEIRTGGWKKPDPPPKRPALPKQPKQPKQPKPPEPQPDQPQHIYEAFGAAEKAYSENQVQLAKDLYKSVMIADPEGLGKVALQRLGDLQKRADMLKAYESFKQMIDANLLDTAQLVWENYVRQYGDAHDPQSYKLLFGTASPKNAPVSNAPEPQPTVMRASTLQNQYEAPIDYFLGRMILIPGGNFIFGDGQDAYLDDFYIDVYPVTNQDYYEFVKATNASPPTTWSHGKFNLQKATHPVTGLTHEQVTAYALWIGKLLPSVEQWEKAARGIDGRQFPWGTQFNNKYCNCRSSNSNSTTPVNMYYEGASPYGVYDLAGNVWEWTNSKTPARGLGHDHNLLIKGGSYKTNEGSLRCSVSSSYPPNQYRDDLGFRLIWQNTGQT